MQKLLIPSLILPLLCLNSCSLVSSWVYKINVQQGNVVTQDMIEKLRPGMDKREVAAVLGTPLLTDPFHPHEWVYVYTDQLGAGRREERVIKVYFEKERLARVGGDVRASPTTP
jgi:outer membrane protein assembly factor BamE